MRRYWKVYQTYFVSSINRELQFRANFFAKIANQLLWIVFVLLILAVIYRNTNSIAGWSRGESTVLAAVAFLMTGVCTMFTFSLSMLPEQVRSGTLDFVVTKPIDSQFWVSTRRFNMDQIGVILAGCVLIGLGLHQEGVTPSVWQWAAFFVLILTSIVIFYAFNLALMTTGIWFVRVENLWVLSESVTQVARYPLDIYSLSVRRALTFGVPMAFLASAPTRQLVRELDGSMVALGLVWAVVMAGLSRAFWRFAMRHYSSASS